MATKNVDHLLAELRQLLQTQYDRGGQDALRRILTAAKKSSNRKGGIIPKRKTQLARSVSRSANHQ